MDRKTRIVEVYGHLHKRVLKLGANNSMFLFSNKCMVNLNHIVEDYLKKSNEEDGILYLIYA